MKSLAYLFVAAAVMSLAAGIVSRVMVMPFIFGLEANAFLRFADTCLLFAIALSAIRILKSK